jgi:HAE1 family hydrophobic/amphiphilic exporter-1
MINYFVRHPTAATLVMIGLLVIGLFSFPQLRRETFPTDCTKQDPGDSGLAG